MREIKFRARTKSGEWFYFDLKTSDTTFADIDWDTVGEFTGLKDKNGKEIYEGDIVKWGDKIQEVGEFGHIPFCWTDGISGESLFVPNELEVIGNVYENPELLVPEGIIPNNQS